jgi:hypothetical protein
VAEKTWMENRSWFWRKIGFWFVPIRAAELGPEQWAKLLKFSRPSMSRRARRIMVLGWIILLAIYACIAFFVAHHDAAGAIGPVVIALLFAWLAFTRMRISLSRISLEDRALVEYGETFEALQQSQRITLAEKYLREGIWGNRSFADDERETGLRLRSAATAYRLLRYGLVLVLAAYWAFCLFGPFPDATRDVLARTAVAFSFLVLSVLALPTIVRMWTQPDDAGEPKLVAAATPSDN